jgi:hypothetical protein
MSGVNEVTSDREGDGEEINEFIIAVERYWITKDEYDEYITRKL